MTEEKKSILMYRERIVIAIGAIYGVSLNRPWERSIRTALLNEALIRLVFFMKIGSTR